MDGREAVPGEDAAGAVAWRISREPVAYEAAVAAMAARVAAIGAGSASELVWLLEHPSLYTAGTSTRSEHLPAEAPFPLHPSGRGGQLTYHGPGQRIAYVMLDLKRRGGDVRRYVWGLEEWMIRTLARLGITGERRAGRVGVWVARGRGREDKIAALGVRVSRWVTWHGVALNRDPELAHFRAIVPCGIAAPQFGVTSLADLGVRVSAEELDAVLGETFAQVFEATGAVAAGKAGKKEGRPAWRD